MANEFSVYQFFDDENEVYERIVQFVEAKMAVEKAHFFTHNVSAKIGLTKRVIITDGSDRVCFEWKFGEGVVFPPQPEKDNG